MRVVAPVHAHGSLLGAVSTQRGTREQSNIFEGSIVLVPIEKIRARIVGHVKVGPAVIVVVSPGRAQAVVVMGIVHSGFFRNLFKGTVTVVMKKQIGFARQSPGTALHQHSLEAAEARIVTE